MPRDSGGTYSLPSGSTATTGTTILASEHNTPLADIASALTGSLPVDGSKGMSGVLKLADGTAANPSIAFGSDTTTGFYKKSAGVLGYSAGGLDSPLSVPAGVVLPYGGIVIPTGWLRADGSAVSRTTYGALFTALTITGNATKDGTATLNSVDTDFTSYGLVGAYIEGTGIANGTTITAITVSTITLSASPTGTGAIAIRILPHGQGDGSTTFYLPNHSGRVSAGREATATRLTAAGSGIDGGVLGATGGVQNKAIAVGYLPASGVSVTVPKTIIKDSGGSNTLKAVISGSAVSTEQAGSSDNVYTIASFTDAYFPATTVTSAALGSGTAFPVAQPTIILNFIIKT